MKEQNHATYVRCVPMFHVVTLGLIVLTLIGSCATLYTFPGDELRIYSACLIVVAAVFLLFHFFSLIAIAGRLKDRTICSEENSRHNLLTGNPLDLRLTMRQIFGLRFASDQEIVPLAGTATEAGLSGDAIRRAVRRGRADSYRV